MSSRTEAMRQMPRRHRGGERTARATARARVAPYVSGAFGLIVLALVVVFLQQTGVFTSNRKPAEQAAALSDHVTVTTSTITGLDSQKRPYSISARTAVQDKNEPRYIHLDEVQGATNRNNGDAITFAAKKGRYDSDVKALDLNTEVLIKSEGRFTARMDKAHVVVKEKRLTSDVPVAVVLKNGTINANGVEISNDGNNILFLKGVKAHFGSAKSEGESTP